MGFRCDGMIHPAIALGIYVQFRPERLSVLLVLGASVNQRTLFPAERRAAEIGFKEILPQFGPDPLEQKPQMGE